MRTSYPGRGRRERRRRRGQDGAARAPDPAPATPPALRGGPANPTRASPVPYTESNGVGVRNRTGAARIQGGSRVADKRTTRTPRPRKAADDHRPPQRPRTPPAGPRARGRAARGGRRGHSGSSAPARPAQSGVRGGPARSHRRTRAGPHAEPRRGARRHRGGRQDGPRFVPCGLQPRGHRPGHHPREGPGLRLDLLGVRRHGGARVQDPVRPRPGARPQRGQPGRSQRLLLEPVPAVQRRRLRLHGGRLLHALGRAGHRGRRPLRRPLSPPPDDGTRRPTRRGRRDVPRPLLRPGQ